MTPISTLLQHTFTAMSRQLGHNPAQSTQPLWQRRQSDQSPFCRALVSCGYLTEQQMQQAARRYRLGKTRDEGVIFWQIDDHDELRDGKIMYYRPDCHRDHDRNPTWASYQLRRAGLLPDSFRSDHCLFGLHLLAPEAAAATAAEAVAVVESEKTAVIMSALRPDFIWMATGGKTELNVAKLKPLAGRRVILFPDTDETGDTYRDWFDVARAATDVFGHPFTVSSLLEQRASPRQRAAKIDIVDLLFPAPGV